MTLSTKNVERSGASSIRTLRRNVRQLKVWIKTRRNSRLPLLRKKLLRMDVVQAEHNMPMSQVQMLAMLGENGALSVSEISKRLGIAKPNITPLIDRLIDEGFVERRRDENDRRVVNVVLLPAGEEKLTSIRETIVRQVMRWTGTIPEKEFFELEHALQTISTVLESAQF